MFSFDEIDFPIIFFDHLDYDEVNHIIANEAKTVKLIPIEFEYARGKVSFLSKDEGEGYDSNQLEEFLKDIYITLEQTELLIIIKDAQYFLNQSYIQPKIVGRLKSMAQIIEKFRFADPKYQTKICLVSTNRDIPIDLKRYVYFYDINPPNIKEINKIFGNFAKVHRIGVTEEYKEKMALCCRGLESLEIKKLLNYHYKQNNQLDDRLIEDINRIKKQNIKKTGVLELIEVERDLEIGGLYELQEWLRRKAMVFNTYNTENRTPTSYRIEKPRGVLTVGIPGCGKSLAAKVTANLFNVPLIRLDIGSLLGKYLGDSEENMRRALLLAEANNPCILWLDEVEKAFSGIGGEGAHEVTTRIFGFFLTWMQENKSRVFIVATANDVSKLPPEFLRKGRFDDIFLVDFPTLVERREIFSIHLKKNQQFVKDVDNMELAKKTEGYTGADIKSIVDEVFENGYYYNKQRIHTHDFMEAIEDFPNFKKMMGSKVEELKEKLESLGAKDASKVTSTSIIIKKINDCASYKKETFKHGATRKIIFGSNKQTVYIAVGSSTIHELIEKEGQIECSTLLEETKKDLKFISKTKDNKIYGAMTNKGAIIWTGSNSQIFCNINNEKSYASAMAMTADGQMIAIAYGTDIKLYEVKTGNILATLKAHKEEIVALCYSDDKSMLASACLNNKIVIWDLKNKREKKVLEGHSKGIRQLVFLERDHYLLSASKDYTAKIWGLIDNSRNCRTLNRTGAAVNAIAYNKKKKFMVVADARGDIFICDPKDGSIIETIHHKNGVESVAISDDGSRIAIIDSELYVYMWNLEFE